MKPETVKRTTVFRGNLINVRVDTMADGARREMVEHPGAAAIAAVYGSDRIVLVRQYRHGAGRQLLEVPAGLLEPDEEPLDCARRELMEETGFGAGSWRHLFTMYSSPGFLTERIHLFLACELELVGSGPDLQEISGVEVVSIRAAWEMIEDGQIEDAKTIAAIAAALLPHRSACP